MGWTKIDDAILTNPKMLEAEDACPTLAPLLWFKALVYTNQHKLDGFVPEKMVSRLLGKHRAAKSAAEALVSAGLWHRVDGGFVFHNFEKHNASGQQREGIAKKNREKQQKFRDEQRAKREAVTGYADERNQDITGNDFGVTPSRARPVPSRPVPTSPVPSSAARPERDDATSQDPDSPTESELFVAYAEGLSQALGCLTKPQRIEANAYALTTVWGVFGMPSGQTKAQFLAYLPAKVGEYVADAKARQQPPTFEAGFSPKRFLDWLQATRDGVDPFPRAPVAVGGQKRREGGKAGQQSGMPSPYGDPTPEELRMAGVS